MPGNRERNTDKQTHKWTHRQTNKQRRGEREKGFGFREKGIMIKSS